MKTYTEQRPAKNSCVRCANEMTCGYSPLAMLHRRTETSAEPCPIGLRSDGRPFFIKKARRHRIFKALVHDYTKKMPTWLYGVLDPHGCVLYEPMFSKQVAQRIRQLYNSPNPPRDWEETDRILVRMGLLEQRT